MRATFVFLLAVVALVAFGWFSGLLSPAGTLEPDSPGIDRVEPERQGRASSEGSVVFDRTEGVPDVEPSDAGMRLPDPVDLEAADRDLDLHGIVVDREGQPVAGAEIVTLTYPWRRVSVLNREGYDEVVEGARTRSARDGTFRLRLSRGQGVNLRAVAAGFALHEEPGCLAGEFLRIVLDPEARLEVRARDEDGRGVPDVRLRFWRRGAVSSFGGRRGKTDAEGRFVFNRMQPGRGSLSLEHEVLGSSGWERVELAQGVTTTREITLRRGRLLTGRVIDAITKDPIAGAKVGENWVLDRRVETDVDGRYAYPGWTGEGVIDLHVVAEGYGRQGKEVPAEGEIDFELKPGDEARGRILSASGQPVAGALVTAMAFRFAGGKQEVDTRSTRTKPDGAFHLTSLRHDLPHTLVIQAAGHGRYLLDFDPHEQEPGIIDLADITLPKALAIEGVARKTAGEPLSNAVIEIEGHNEDRGRLREGKREVFDMFYGRSESRRTDDLGRFRFPDLSPGSYRLKLTPRGQPEIVEKVVLEDQDIRDVVLEVAEGLTLTVLVLDSKGAPLAGVRVHLDYLRDRIRGTTDGAGRFAFSGLREVSYSVQAYDFDRNLTMHDDVTQVPAGQEIVLTLHSQVGLRGQVLDEKGEPLTLYRVVAKDGDGKGGGDFTDEEGKFEVSARPGTVMTLEVNGQRRRSRGSSTIDPTPYRGQVTGVLAPADGIMIHAKRIPQDQKITVLVVDPEGVVVPDATVMVSSSIKVPDVKTDASGRASIEGLIAEDLRVIVFPPADSPWIIPKTQILKPAGQELTLRLRRRAILAGRLVDSVGRARKDVRVMCRSDQDDGFAAKTGEDGRFELRVAAGLTYRISASTSGADGTTLQAEQSGVRAPAVDLLLVLKPEK